MIGLVFKGGKYCMVPGRVTEVEKVNGKLRLITCDSPPSQDCADVLDGLMFVDLEELVAVFNCPDAWHPAHPSRRQKGHRP